MKAESITRRMSEARENESTMSRPACFCIRLVRFAGPITERRKVKPVQSQVTFDNQLKKVPLIKIILLGFRSVSKRPF